MQYRMKTHQLSEEQKAQLLSCEQVASLATLNEDGSPYVTPVHFVYDGEKVYLHGLPAGQKVENIKRDGRVSLAVYRMDGLLLDGEGKPCDTNTKYHSVIIQGTAGIVADEEEKRRILRLIIEKYTPQLSGKELPGNMVKGTCVIAVTVAEMTGKFWE